jgi:hypothetical protein
MFCGLAGPMLASVIEIEFLRPEPPEGWVRKSDGGALHFSGWVGLLQAVWMLVNGAEEAASGLGGQPGA